MNKKQTYVLISIVAGLAALFLSLRSCGKGKAPIEVPVPAPIETLQPLATMIPKPAVTPKQPVKRPVAVVPVSHPAATPPPVQLHTELIPKDIEIVRVYYESPITGPGSSIDFDINGSGFNREFEKMIKVESGASDVAVQNLSLVTPNQIHGTLHIGPSALTGVGFPQVLISNKVVFRAPEPFAVIRPGEVLNLLFTEMSESGRSGRFRMYTNLNNEMFQTLFITASTPTIEITQITPSLPYIVEGILHVGGTPGGTYAMTAKLGEKVIWKRDDMIRVVRPNVGEAGLVQNVQAADGFQRPKDKARFTILGSGFQPADSSKLSIHVPGFETLISSLSYISPGRLSLVIDIPESALEGIYDIEVFEGDLSVAKSAKAFMIVGKNWTKGLIVNPPLRPGLESTLTLQGRDMDVNFISQIKTELDVDDVRITPFKWNSPESATALISVGPDVLPGDYWVKMSVNGKPMSPHLGSIVRVGGRE